MNYEQFVGPLLMAFGGCLQWLRQYEVVKDRWVYILAAVLAGTAYILTHVLGSDWRWEVISLILFVSVNIGTILGGTFIASGLAKAGIKQIPLTSSRAIAMSGDPGDIGPPANPNP